MGKRNPIIPKPRENSRVSALRQEHAKQKSTSRVATSEVLTHVPTYIYLVHRALRTNLANFEGSDHDPESVDQAQNEVYANIHLLNTCSREVGESVARDLYLNRRYRSKYGREVFKWIKHERDPEYRQAIDLANQATISQIVDLNMSKRKGPDTNDILEELLLVLRKLEEEYVRLKPGRRRFGCLSWG